MTEPLPTPTRPPPARKPLPMAWVLAAVGCFIVIHTVVNVAYRKPERPHEPVAEARDRQKKFVQADMKGWTRYAARLTPTTPPAAGTVETAVVTREPAPANLAAALPFDLVGIFTTDPRLRQGPTMVTTPASVTGGGDLRVLLTFDGASSTAGFGEPLAFAKENHLYLFLQDESRTVLDEPATPFAPHLELALPPNVLSVGEWQVSLYAKGSLFTWAMAVR